MSRWNIYNKDGDVRRETIAAASEGTNAVYGAVVYTDSLEYNGSWMGECSVVVSVKSAYPIDWQIGDYIEYRGEVFTLANDPAVIKKARRGAYGEGFTYSNIKFCARHTELTDIMFLDYVLQDNNLHYSSLPDFSFFAEDIDDLCDRLQANTYRWCTDNDIAVDKQWLFLTPSYSRTLQRGTSCGMSETEINNRYTGAYGGTEDADYSVDNEKTDVTVSISKQSVWNTLAIIKSQFGLNFINRGRNVIIGSAGIPTSQLLYGKGNGLSEIERQADSEQQVITKLYAYGSEKNMPVRYYSQVSTIRYATISSLISSSGYGVVVLNLDFNANYFTNRSASFPGSTEYPNYIVRVSAVSGSTESVTVKAYVTKYNNQYSELNGKCYLYCEYGNGSDDRDETSEANVTAFCAALSAGGTIRFKSGVDESNWPASNTDYTASALPNNMALNRLMLPGFPSQSLRAWVLANGGVENTDGSITWHGYTAFFSDEQYNPYILSVNYAELGIRESSKTFDGSDDEYDEVCPTLEGTGYDIIQHAEVITDNGVFDEGDSEPTVTIRIPYISDLDIHNLLEDKTQDGGTPTVALRDGYCGGRDLVIKTAKEITDGGHYWELKCAREYDDLIQLYFPYSYGASQGGSAVANEPYQVRGADITGYDGDRFLLKGIKMTDTYINAAAVKLLEYALQYLAKNDYTRYTYSPKIDEIYMARQHQSAVSSGTTSLYQSIKEGDLLYFADEDLSIGDSMIFIDNLTIKENGNNGIPTFDVTLREEKVVGTIQRLTQQVNSLTTTGVASGGGSGSGSGSKGSGYTLNQLKSIISSVGAGLFLSKVSDDEADGFISFLQGLRISDNFVSGILGEGGVFRLDSDGKTYLETDKLYVRMKAYFDNVEIREYQHTSGNRIVSQAQGFTASRVVWYDSNGAVLEQTDENLSSVAKFRLYWRVKDDDHEVENEFEKGDLAFCHYTDVVDGTLVTKRYWRVVTGKASSVTSDGETYIDVSNINGNIEINDGSDFATITKGCDDNCSTPSAGDDVCQLGNVLDETRQGAIIEYVSGEDSPSYQIYQGIGSNLNNPYTLEDKNYVSLGYSSSTGRAYMNVYGDAYIGDRDGNSYINYDAENELLTIKATISAQSPISGVTGTPTLSSILTAINNDLDNLHNQVDGSIETWFRDGEPGATVEPERTWIEEDEEAGNYNVRLSHVGDLYYDNLTGSAYRYVNTGTTTNPVFSWNEISDTAIAIALQKAQQALDTANGKGKIYVTDGSLPSGYQVGDLWVNVTGTFTKNDSSTVTYNNDILKCISTSYGTIDDWGPASGYTDDSAVNELYNVIVNGAESSEYGGAQGLYAIKTALNGGTLVDGGLVLSSLIKLGVTSGSTFTVWSGINGVYDAHENVLGHGIAAWYGGEQIDYESLTETQQNAGWGTGTGQSRYAKSLFRFDGSGYLASGNITWDDEGIVTIANVYAQATSGSATLQSMADLTQQMPITVINSTSYLDPQTSFTNLSISDGTTAHPVATQDWVNSNYLSIAFFRNLFRAYNGTTEVLPNSGTTVDNIEAMFGFWTEQYISAMGQNSAGGSSGVDMASVWAALADETTDEQISIVHMEEAQQWVNNQGFLTSHQSLAEYTKTADFKTLTITCDSATIITYSPTSEQTIDFAGGDGISLSESTNAITIGLSTSGVTAGTYTKVTVDAYGRATAGTTLSASDIPSLAISKITNLQTTINTINGNIQAAESDIDTLEGYFTGGSAKTAVKLASSVTLWGQTFDGSANVTGSLTGVTDITASGDVSIGGTLTTTGLITANGNIKTASYIDIGDYRIMADATNGGLKVVHSTDDTVAVHFWATGAVSALGMNTTGSGGGGTDLTAVWSSLEENNDENVIHTSHIPTLAIAKINGLQSILNGLSSDISDLDTSISGVSSRVTTAEGEIDTLQGQMTTAEGEIDTLQSQMTTARSNISTLQSQMTTARSNISTLQGYFTSGSANSAVKLTTSRKLWGKSFDGTADVTGSLSSVANITFSADETYSIGTSSRKPLAIYTKTLATTGDVSIDGTTTAHNIIPESTLTYNLGDSDHKWNVLRVNNVYTDGSSSIGGQLMVYGHIVPDSQSNGRQLGLSDNRWSIVAAVDGNFSNDLVVGRYLLPQNSIRFENNVALEWYNNPEEGATKKNMNVLTLTPNNDVVMGWRTRVAGYRTIVHGNPIEFHVGSNYKAWNPYYGDDGTLAFSITSDGNIVPGANNTMQLGSSIYRWSNVYSAGGNFGGGLSVGGNGTFANKLTVSGLLTANGNVKTASYIDIGSYRIIADDDNNGLKVVNSDGTTAANLLATGAVSALGANTTGSGGGSGTNMSEVWAALADNTTEQINAAHLTALTNGLTITCDGATIATYSPLSALTFDFEGANGVTLHEGTNQIQISLTSGICTRGTYTKVKVDTYGRVVNGYSLSASDIPSLAISKITNLQSTLNTLSGSIQSTEDDIDTLQGYFTNGVANSAAKLETAVTLWGQSFDGSTNITGSLTDVIDITASGSASIGGTLTVTDTTTLDEELWVTGGTYLNSLALQRGFSLNMYNNTAGDTQTLGATLAFDADNHLVLTTTNFDVVGTTTLGRLAVSDEVIFNSSLSVEGNTSMIGTLYVEGEVTLDDDLTALGMIYAEAGLSIPASKSIKLGNITITYDSVNNAIHINGGGIYADTFVSALGVSTN